jgi:hypothetical protein
MLGSEDGAPRSRYTGNQTNCAGCGREIKLGDKIDVHLEEDLIFCQIDPKDEANCIMQWVNRNDIEIPAGGIAFEEMIYRGPAAKLPEYGGSKSFCDHCQKDFQFGETILVDMPKQLVFCWSEPGPESCFVKWPNKGGILDLHSMRFHGNT